MRLILRQCGHFRRFSSSSCVLTEKDRLRIAFFGTDTFSVESLNALNQYKCTAQGSEHIERLDLITRSPKASGRGRKIYKEPASISSAREQGLDVIIAETKDEINALADNSRYNIAIAVSYGKLIPSDFINSLKYGGYNVHPSLLPSLRGPAPVHHALLQGLAYTGVTVQSLHPTQFDKGRVIYQTDKLPISKDTSFQSLLGQLATEAGKSLAHTIRARLYEDPTLNVETDADISYAPKVTLKDKEVSLLNDSIASILRKHRVFGALHFFQNTFLRRTKLERKQKRTMVRRIIMDDLYDASETHRELMAELEIGQYVIPEDEDVCLVKTKDGVLGCSSLLLEGFAFQKPHAFKKAAAVRGVYNNQLEVE